MVLLVNSSTGLPRRSGIARTVNEKIRRAGRIARSGCGFGSPTRSQQRTFVWAWFDLPKRAYRRKQSQSIQPKRRNPVALALEWQQRLDSGEFSSRAELAHGLAVTRAHVTQVLGLLHFTPEMRELILGLGDPIGIKGLGIHTLRSMLHLPVERQISSVKEHAVFETA